ncbi:hypothetical protein NP493_989g01006 [Ridgeia piscesae]|uniref:Non-structural maintenance of chromosomes element 4 n=1 Tax=Ridgeia piscesae TaxID=27915 RepID=A0AAD9NL01_RIDPI|nr:hypothetical protein NP493_989g01006 [Ridgeia piscesae]
MEDHGDPEKRRTIRYKYRTLLQKTQDNHQELIRPESDQLQKTLDEADKLFQDVKQPREAALDSQLLAAVSNLSKKKAQSLQADFVAFEPIEYAEKLMAYVSGNRLPDDRQKVNQDGWESLGEAVQSFFNRSPPLNFMCVQPKGYYRE